ncbi:uncharacterized protein isoform X2 [Choristoneura fumiferana]|uniref:uncharacterized protein isoform X2 n=1 Tax=Choristoneura fumiferana TaxID=7141 RepID=UPI003D154D98
MCVPQLLRLLQNEECYNHSFLACRSRVLSKLRCSQRHRRWRTRGGRRWGLLWWGSSRRRHRWGPRRCRHRSGHWRSPWRRGSSRRRHRWGPRRWRHRSGHWRSPWRRGSSRRRHRWGLVAGGTGAAIGAALGGGEAVGAAVGGGLVAGGTGAAIGATLGGDLLGDAPPAGGKDIFHALGIFTKGIPDAVGKDKLIFEDVVNLKLPGVLQDGFVSLIVVGRADGGIVNTIIPGFGTLLGNVVIAIGKIFDCVLAPQG